MSKNDKSLLINKCEICHKKAVGFHYGAYVCEACKKFFVRHSSGSCRLYGFCQEKGNCDLNIDGRGKCQHCRYKRCVEIGMNIDSKSSDYDLTSIPCQVCGSKSSGLHFGCITCEGCKGFYRRMIKLKGTLVCFKDNKCKLDMKNRSTCKSCRMNRCLEVGMSRKGIRIGRHTNSMKYNCLNMLKFDKASEITEDSASDEQTGSSKSDMNDNIQLSEVELTVTKIDNSEIDKDIIDANETIDPVSISQTDTTIDDSKFNINFNSAKCNEEQTLNCSPMKADPPVEDEIEQERSSEETINIQNSLGFASQFLNHFKPCSSSKDIVSEDDSIDIVWSLMMEHFIQHSQFIVKFAKLMPGFLRLSLSDKRSVIKYSMYPMILLELSEDYRCTKLGTYFNYFDFSLNDRHLILKYFPEFKRFSLHLEQSGDLRFSLNLDTFEITALCGIMMFYNHHNLENWMYGKSMILLYQEYLTTYFRSHLKLSDHDVKIRKKKCLDYISVLNEMNLQHHEIIIDFCSSHHELDFPDLFIQIFNH